MKKILIALTAFALCLASVSSQELAEQSVVNTLWTGFGLPASSDSNLREYDSIRWAGFVETAQARIDIWKFTIDGMLAWSALTNWSGTAFSTFAVDNTPLSQFQFMGEYRDMTSYYLNFVARPLEGLEIGAGTQLNWSVGASPYSDGLAWEVLAHVVQGDLKKTYSETGAPQNGKGLAGYMHYANTYAEKAIAVRYNLRDIVTFALAIPGGADDKRFTVNAAIEATPIEMLKVSFAYENIGIAGGNMYTGANVDLLEWLKFDIWAGLDGIGYNSGDSRKMWGIGGAIYLRFGSLPFWLRPEVGFSQFIFSDNTASFYTGGRLNWDITEALHLGIFTSFAWGAEDTRWKDSSSVMYRPDWTGGFIWNIRPDFTFDINEEHSLSTVFEYAGIINPDGTKENKMLFGFFWKFKKLF